MITFRIIAFDQQKNERPFMVENLALEQGLDAINHLVTAGFTLRDVQLWDERGIQPLPVEAFTGESIAKPLLDLKAEWEQLLLPPSEPATSKNALIDWLDQEFAFEDQYIARLNQLVTQIALLALLTRSYELIVGYSDLVEKINTLSKDAGLRRQRLDQLHDKLKQL